MVFLRTIGGVALIGAAVAIGQFDRTRLTVTPIPSRAGPPLMPPPDHGPQPTPGRGHPGTW